MAVSTTDMKCWPTCVRASGAARTRSCLSSSRRRVIVSARARARARAGAPAAAARDERTGAPGPSDLAVADLARGGPRHQPLGDHAGQRGALAGVGAEHADVARRVVVDEE